MPTHLFISSPAIPTPAGRQKKACAFCPLDEQPIFAGRNANVLAAAFPYVHKHVLIVPKEHATSLGALDKGAMAQTCFFIDALLSTDNKLAVLANERRLAGSTQEHHSHLHVLEPPTPDFPTAHQVQLRQSLEDPIARELIIAAKLSPSGKYPFAAETEIDLSNPPAVLDAIKTSFTELHAALRANVESFASRFSEAIASQHIDARSKPFGDELGFNLCITLENGKAMLYTAPRILLLKLVKEDGKPHRYSGNELFFNFTSERVGLDETTTRLWQLQKGTFHNWVKTTIVAG
ncbi:Uncharacterised protein [Candidatus Anstonella stagnisolia]|nr:Uncharacterised protein [Candidatus Anstonella stagnisolia]